VFASLIPLLLKDLVGIRVSAAVLDYSLDPGLHEEFIQRDMFLGMITFITNLSQAGTDGLVDTVAAYKQNKVWMYSVVIHLFLFSRFMSGLHKRVGEVRKQDEPVTIDVLLKVSKILEGKRQITWALRVKPWVAKMGVWFVAGFCTGLSVKEKLLIQFSGTATRSLKFFGDPECPHFILVILGHKKGMQPHVLLLRKGHTSYQGDRWRQQDLQRYSSQRYEVNVSTKGVPRFRSVLQVN
jgi:hypothetical protein